MEKNKKKKKWEKPCLTIILRGRIEENILGNCPPPPPSGTKQWDYNVS